MTGRAVVTGAAGFLGSHLCERLLSDGWDVVGVDSLLTGNRSNLASIEDDPRFAFLGRDVADGLHVDGDIDLVAHLASSASPMDYLKYPIETLAVGATGTRHALDLAAQRDATFLLASTSEVYGDPLVHPQPESYWGNVNPVGPRSVYDEAKRFAEALTAAYGRTFGTRVRVARIFNSFGPRMRRGDGRAVPTFLAQALAGEPITVHGSGAQTRSLCFVSDTIDGLARLATSDVDHPVNLGSPSEVSVRELAEQIRAIVGADVPIIEIARPEDDPQVRCPDITRARTELGWEPKISLEDGLRRTSLWARSAWGMD